MPIRRAFACVALLACVAAALVPCPPAVAAGAAGVAAVAAGPGGAPGGIVCRGERPPDLLPACPCGCRERPSAAGVPVAPGLALLAAAPALVPPPGERPLADGAVVVRGVPRAAPDPVPLTALPHLGR